MEISDGGAAAAEFSSGDDECYTKEFSESDSDWDVTAESEVEGTKSGEILSPSDDEFNNDRQSTEEIC